MEEAFKNSSNVARWKWKARLKSTYQTPGHRGDLFHAWLVRGAVASFGHLGPFAGALRWTFERRLRSEPAIEIAVRFGKFSAISDIGLGSTSAMWRIADGSCVEHPGGCFLHQRTHTPDPLRSFSLVITWPQSCHSQVRLSGR